MSYTYVRLSAGREARHRRPVTRSCYVLTHLPDQQVSASSPWRSDLLTSIKLEHRHD
ncbi:MAG: hypothetical protein V9H69_18240 [Anaerolineae bacterium]